VMCLSWQRNLRAVCEWLPLVSRASVKELFFSIIVHWICDGIQELVVLSPEPEPEAPLEVDTLAGMSVHSQNSWSDPGNAIAP